MDVRGLSAGASADGAERGVSVDVSVDDSPPAPLRR